MELYLRQLISFTRKQGSSSAVDSSLVDNLAAMLGPGPGAAKPGQGGRGKPDQGERGNEKPKPNIADEDDKKEYFDSKEELAKKLDMVTDWVKNSKHVIVFTGAGISTR